MAASSVGETVVAAAAAVAVEDNSNSNSSSAQQLPLKKAPSRPTAVSTVYELLTRPQPTISSTTNGHSPTPKVMLLQPPTAMKAANGHHHHHQHQNHNRSTSPSYYCRSNFTNGTNYSSNGKSSASPLMAAKTLSPAAITANGNGHSYHNNQQPQTQFQNNNSSSPSSLHTNGTTTASSVLSSYSPSTSPSYYSSSSSNHHSPNNNNNNNTTSINIQTPPPPPIPPKRNSLQFGNGNGSDRLLVVESSAFEMIRAKFTLASPDDDDGPDNEEDYPAEIVMCSTNAAVNRYAAWASNAINNHLPFVSNGDNHHTAVHHAASTGYMSNGHSPASVRRRSSCLCSSLGLQCRDNTSGSSSPSLKPATPVKPAQRSPSGATESTAATAQRSASSIKDALLKWCQQVTTGYEHVNVTNFSSSWADGMAFCAIVHHYFPNAFDFGRLDPKKRKGNFKLAFDLAEKLGDVPQLLEVEDMVRMKQPDWKCVFTYVQTMYRKLHDKQPTYLPPRKTSGDNASTGETCGTSTSSTSGVESVSSADSPSKLSPMPVMSDDHEGLPSNPFKEEFAKLNVSS